MNRPAISSALVLLLLGSSTVTAMTLTSTDITAGGAIPSAQLYPRCGGRNISPQLAWSGAPRTTQSFVLTMIDVDVKPSQWSHWIVVELPATVSSLPQGVESLPGSAKALVSNFGDAAYAGPCPPKGSGVHHYQFTIWALATITIALTPDEKATDVTALLSKCAIDHASLTGFIQAPTS
jgi:Raf kinase inhibitor-like YbhB/YbcL family protein